MCYDLIVSNYRHTISDADFEKCVPASFQAKFREISERFKFPELKQPEKGSLDSLINQINVTKNHFYDDPELWLEMIGRIIFGEKVAKNPIFVFYDLRSGGTFAFDKTGKPLSLNNLTTDLPQFGIKLRPDTDVDRYDLKPEVQQYLNRRFTHASLEDFDNNLAKFEDFGENLFVKLMVRGKAGVFKINPRQPLSHIFITSAMMCWHDTDLFIQEVADIRYEMRCFCVNGKVVTSAGAIDQFTWLQNLELFDPQLQEFRGKSRVKILPKVRDRLINFAKQAAAEITPLFENKQFSLDVAIINGKPGIIELNSLSNSGLYACDVEALIRKIYSL